MEDSDEQRVMGALITPEVVELLDARQNQLAREALMELLAPEIADVLMDLPPGHRAIAFRLLSRDKEAEVFLLLPIEEQEKLLNELSNEQLSNLFNEMESDDRVQLFEEMPGQVVQKLLGLMKPEERRRTQIVLGYPPESIGRIMTPDYLTAREDWTAQQTIDHIRIHGKDAETFNSVFIINDRGRLIDDVRIRQIILADPAEKIEHLMDGQVVSLRATDDREEAVRVMERYDLPQLPVIDRDDILVGMVTFDDVADVAQEEATEDIQKMAGMAALEEPYKSATILDLVRKRIFWLIILFFGELLAVSAMGVFEDSIKRLAMLAMFVPLIIASGGNSGSQAASLMIRSLALGELALRDWAIVIRREIVSGLVMGTILGLTGMAIAATLAAVMFADDAQGHAPLHYGLAIGTAIVAVVIIGTTIGSMLPFIMQRLGFDPATSSNPLIATLMDFTGLVIYFLIANIILTGTLF